MRARPTGHPPSRLAASLMFVLTVACSEAAPAGVRPAGSSPEESPRFFAAAVDYFVRRAEYPVRVDPRPLRPEARLYSVSTGDLLPVAPEILQMRAAVVQEGGWRLADAVADWGCVFAEGLPPARPPSTEGVDSLRLRREACRSRGRFESLILGLPQGETDPAHPHRWRVQTMRLMLHGFEVVDLYLELDAASGEWSVVDARVRSGVRS